MRELLNLSMFIPFSKTVLKHKITKGGEDMFWYYFIPGNIIVFAILQGILITYFTKKGHYNDDEMVKN